MALWVPEGANSTRSFGSCENSPVVRGEGGWEGHLSDWPGAVKCIE